ncbi:zinc finger-like domain-containing protein [Chitinophaga sp. sic0106]|uniref:zinc finger-like domain-containing protein n=1 Tax=Chitinophaga sp. sic0106 TaxID=2854785 RepID=UPI001C47EA81|nr:zinc finger-like domain-containing protein [Chitinophaga sp. sic0106]MBV7531337.1 hypothetical protein [Chitinophaga sp. sic0106]
MILTRTDIIRILKERPNAASVLAGQQMNKVLAVHIAGIGMKPYLELINSFENEDQARVRQKYAKSNKDVFERLGRPIDDVFTARGGSILMDLPKEQQRVMHEYMADVEWGYSLREWMANIALPYYKMDPMGLVMMEVGQNEAYPTYKCVADIYDYQLSGRKPEYVVFTTPIKNTYRVVDDANDRTVRWDGGDSIQFTEVFTNYWGYVPARVISDLLRTGEQVYCSPFDAVVELADQVLRDGSVKNVLKLKHGFPKWWQHQISCSDCKSTGLKEGKSCPSCKGTGKKLSYDVADVINVPIPKNGDPQIAPDVAGYIAPPIDGLDMLTAEIKLLEEEMVHTVWGTYDKENSKDTAFAWLLDAQPKIKRQNKFANWAEYLEQFILTAMCEFYYPSSFKGCSVNYGRCYIQETPEAAWEKYQDARKNGAPQTSLDELLREYYYTKYSHNSLELQKHIRLMKIEPFVHQTIQEAKLTAGGTVDYVAKLYFTEWLGTLGEGDPVFVDQQVLRSRLYTYAEQKYKAMPKPITV